MIPLVRNKSARETQRGQSIAEVMISLPFMMAIVIGLVDVGIAFGAFVSEVNAAREGAIYASMYPKLASPTCGSTPYPDCTSANDFDTDRLGSNIWQQYHDRVSNEIAFATAQALESGKLLTSDTLTIDRPILGPTSTACPTGSEAGCPITVTVRFRIHTLTSDMQLPYFGRFGLPNYYQINYSYGVPIR